MFHLNSLVQKAQSLIDPNASAPNSRPSDNHPSKAALFRLQFRLPDSQNPLQEVTAELSFSSPSAPRVQSSAGNEKFKPHERSNTYVGKLHLSESFLCFSTQPTSFHPSASIQASSGFNGQTHGTGPAGNGFTFPLCAIRRVERLQTQNALFALAITTWNGFTVSSPKRDPGEAQKVTVQLAGSRQACEQFCDGLKRGLRSGTKEVESLKTVVSGCYSEHLLSVPERKPKGEAVPDTSARQPPDAGLGMVFRYPGDARKLRDRSKMRLWGEYLRGSFFWIGFYHVKI